MCGRGDGATPRAAAAAALRPSQWAPRASSPSRFNAKGDAEGQEGLSHACPEVGRYQTLGKPKHFASPTDGVTPEPVPALEQTASMSTPKSQAAPVIQGWGKGEHQAAPLCQAEGVGFCVTATQNPEPARKIPVPHHGNRPGAPGEGAGLMGAAGRGDGTRWMGSALTNRSSTCQQGPGRAGRWQKMRPPRLRQVEGATSQARPPGPPAPSAGGSGWGSLPPSRCSGQLRPAEAVPPQEGDMVHPSPSRAAFSPKCFASDLQKENN